VFALVGVSVGFLFLVVPGLLMRRSYQDWRTGARSTPGAAGVLGALVVCLAAAGVLWFLTPWWVLSILVVMIGLPPALAVAARG
jgi:hypothetical protein